MYGLGCVRSDSFAGLVCYRSESHFWGGCRKNATKMFSKIIVLKSSAKVQKIFGICKFLGSEKLRKMEKREEISKK